jgi:hypothetical protein
VGADGGRRTWGEGRGRAGGARGGRPPGNPFPSSPTHTGRAHAHEQGLRDIGRGGPAGAPKGARGARGDSSSPVARPAQYIGEQPPPPPSSRGPGKGCEGPAAAGSIGCGRITRGREPRRRGGVAARGKKDVHPHTRTSESRGRAREGLYVARRAGVFVLRTSLRTGGTGRAGESDDGSRLGEEGEFCTAQAFSTSPTSRAPSTPRQSAGLVCARLHAPCRTRTRTLVAPRKPRRRRSNTREFRPSPRELTKGSRPPAPPLTSSAARPLPPAQRRGHRPHHDLDGQPHRLHGARPRARLGQFPRV